MLTNEPSAANAPELSPYDEVMALRGVLKVIANPSYVGNYSDAEVVEIYRKWAQSALDGGPYAKP